MIPAHIHTEILKRIKAAEQEHNVKVLYAIELLLERKKQSMEKELAPAIPALNQFIESMLEHYEEHKPAEVDTERDIEQLNLLFKKSLTV